MTDPTPLVRRETYKRDRYRCVSCGAAESLQYQHRRAEGMGGRAAFPKFEEGVTSCALCNPLYENTMQRAALKNGWKVRSWVADRGLAGQVPLFVAWERIWYELLVDGGLKAISRDGAVAMMRSVYGEIYDPEKGLVF